MSPRWRQHWLELLHVLAHRTGWQAVCLEMRQDGFYLRCVACGHETFFAHYGDTEQRGGQQQ